MTQDVDEPGPLPTRLRRPRDVTVVVTASATQCSTAPDDDRDHKPAKYQVVYGRGSHTARILCSGCARRWEFTPIKTELRRIKRVDSRNAIAVRPLSREEVQEAVVALEEPAPAAEDPDRTLPVAAEDPEPLTVREALRQLRGAFANGRRRRAGRR